MFRNHEVCRGRTFANAGGRIIMRSVARAEIAAKFTFYFALCSTQRHAAEMGTDAQGNQPVFLASRCPLRQRFRIAQTGNIDRIGFGDFRFCQVADENRLFAPTGLDRLLGLNRRDIDFNR